MVKTEEPKEKEIQCPYCGKWMFRAYFCEDTDHCEFYYQED